MMTIVIFAGDMLVMAFMISLFVWFAVRAGDGEVDATARIPLEDEKTDG